MNVQESAQQTTTSARCKKKKKEGEKQDRHAPSLPSSPNAKRPKIIMRNWSVFATQFATQLMNACAQEYRAVIYKYPRLANKHEQLEARLKGFLTAVMESQKRYMATGAAACTVDWSISMPKKHNTHTRLLSERQRYMPTEPLIRCVISVGHMKNINTCTDITPPAMDAERMSTMTTGDWMRICSPDITMPDQCIYFRCDKDGRCVCEYTFKQGNGINTIVDKSNRTPMDTWFLDSYLPCFLAMLKETVPVYMRTCSLMQSNQRFENISMEIHQGCMDAFRVALSLSVFRRIGKGTVNWDRYVSNQTHLCAMTQETTTTTQQSFLNNITSAVIEDPTLCDSVVPAVAPLSMSSTKHTTVSPCGHLTCRARIEANGQIAYAMRVWEKCAMVHNFSLNGEQIEMDYVLKNDVVIVNSWRINLTMLASILTLHAAIKQQLENNHDCLFK